MKNLQRILLSLYFSILLIVVLLVSYTYNGLKNHAENKSREQFLKASNHIHLVSRKSVATMDFQTVLNIIELMYSKSEMKYFKIFSDGLELNEGRSFAQFNDSAINFSEVDSNTFEAIVEESNLFFVKKVFYFDDTNSDKIAEFIIGFSLDELHEHRDKLFTGHVLIAVVIIMIITAIFLLGFFYMNKSLLSLKVYLMNIVKRKEDVKEHLIDVNYTALARPIKELILMMKDKQAAIIENMTITSKYEISKQVAHDIRSPLAALNMITKDLNLLPESTRIILRGSINRIQDIANNLLQQNKIQSDNDELMDIYLVAPILNEIVSEKRTQLRSNINVIIEFDVDNVYGIFAYINQAHLKRVISNLVNNSLDALGSTKGKITVSLARNSCNDNIIIKVSDTGAGIPKNILDKLGQKGASYGKEAMSESGAGLGLYHAKTSIEAWKGEFLIELEVGKGTDIILSLPSIESPKWFVESLKISNKQQIIIIDDDTSIHQVWDRRFGEISKDVEFEIIHFTNPDEISNWIESNSIKNDTIFLCDYEFIGHDKNGLDLICENNIASQSILVTSHYEEDEIRTLCNKLGVKLIPKMIVDAVPFSILKPVIPLSSIDLIHLDDDDLVRMCWDFSAKKANKKIISFSAPEDLREELSEISTETPFYIDSCLGEGVINGEDFAKELFDLGYENLYMSTGFEKDKFENSPWIKDITGKSPPWDNV